MWHAGAVWYAVSSGTWAVDPSKARDLPHCDNAVEVVVQNLGSLQEGTMKALTAAVCVGRVFYAGDVAAVLGCELDEAVHELRLACTVGNLTELRS